MDSIDDIEIAACAAPSQIGYTHRVRGLVVIGLIAGLAAVVTGLFSIIGILITAALLRSSTGPAQRFVWTAMSLTTISLVPPSSPGRTPPAPAPSSGYTSSLRR